MGLIRVPDDIILPIPRDQHEKDVFNAIRDYVNSLNETLASFQGVGAYASATVGSATQVTADSFVISYGTPTGANPSTEIRSDSSNPPTTVRARSQATNDSEDSVFACAFIRTGEYYLITNTNITGSANIVTLS